jgi:hypothetical protein
MAAAARGPSSMTRSRCAMIDAATLDLARSVRIEDELARRGVKLRGLADRCGPCPRCGGNDRFSAHIGDQVFNCRGCGGKGRGTVDLVMFLDGSGFKEAVATLAGIAPERTVCNIAKQPDLVAKQPKEELPSGTEKLALALWRAAVDPRGTIVHCYLEHRALDLPDEVAGEAIRFHSACPMGEESHPAMVCLVRNILTNERQAIHRTALTADGTAIKRNGKTFRMSLGPVRGGAVKIDPDEDVTQGLCIGEGVETCLAGRQMGLRPVWSAVNTSGVANFPVLPGVVGLHILRDNDTAPILNMAPI